MSEILKGTVKFFNEGKGFGFITGDDGTELFVHRSGISEGVLIKDNDKITYEKTMGDRGLKAINVNKQ